MLTVLVKHKDTGREVLFPADSVEMQESGPGAGLLIRGKQSDGIDGRHLAASATSGDARDVFVMNDSGATVARYTL